MAHGDQVWLHMAEADDMRATDVDMRSADDM
eukprot:CAMPEP_0115851868 /NCGR_PEP_ID=MMETSP0287-20121206/12702_1 /TAXON_ID=412157 /ORGANISM="Chrysochromulina rotalis, Strain UIO044" /LENGTH=30 /DNA_ID= /DNA_START= /DNA_END= /DNA_ORIENTATION=